MELKTLQLRAADFRGVHNRWAVPQIRPGRIVGGINMDLGCNTVAEYHRDIPVWNARESQKLSKL
jgi:hypothetical protein